MNRREFLFQSAFLTAGAAFPFDNLFTGAAGNFTPLRRNVGYFTERGGTIGWLAAEDGLAMVDSQYPQTVKHCLNGLQKKTSHAVDLLINTHHHGDHTSGNPVFEGVAGKMAAHKNVPILMKKANQKSEDNTNTAYPKTTYSDSWMMEVGDEKVHAQYFGPAHTGGDSVIYFEKANVVHMGI